MRSPVGVVLMLEGEEAGGYSIKAERKIHYRK
jgi:hypothetical protein